MMRTIHLYGPIAKRFGESFNLDVVNAAEAIRALAANLGKDFLALLKAGEWHVIAGDSFEDGDDFGNEEMLHFGLGSNDLHIVPAIQGADSGRGLPQIIIGVVIVVASIYTAGAAAPAGTSLAASMSAGVGGSAISYGSLAGLGASIALSGIATALTPVPKIGNGYGDREEVGERPSFLFTGAKNQQEQGGPIPIVYGQHRVGWTLVSSGVEIEEI